VSELQALLTDWLTELAAVLPFGFAFGVGMVAVVNPCGFAMLPAYLSLYLGAHEDDFGKSPSMTRLLRALLVGATVSSGFVVLFGLAGLIVSVSGTLLLDVMPSLGIVIGGVLVLVELGMLAGRTLQAGVFEQFAGRVGDPSNVSVPGFFLFGLAYGAASLSCTLPAFLAVVGSSLASGGVTGRGGSVPRLRFEHGSSADDAHPGAGVLQAGPRQVAAQGCALRAARLGRPPRAGGRVRDLLLAVVRQRRCSVRMNLAYSHENGLVPLTGKLRVRRKQHDVF
jgi:cytochrome c biogenesis protein CcdA